MGIVLRGAKAVVFVVLARHLPPRTKIAKVVVATLLATLGLAGLTATPAAAADTITFRAAAQAVVNQPALRVTIPASVRETDGMLLFVTTNKARMIATPPRVDARRF